jgi:hypothetical protein
MNGDFKAFLKFVATTGTIAGILLWIMNNNRGR